jgi:hypothetical protein
MNFNQGMPMFNNGNEQLNDLVKNAQQRMEGQIPPVQAMPVHDFTNQANQSQNTFAEQVAASNRQFAEQVANSNNRFKEQVAATSKQFAEQIQKNKPINPDETFEEFKARRANPEGAQNENQTQGQTNYSSDDFLHKMARENARNFEEQSKKNEEIFKKMQEDFEDATKDYVPNEKDKAARNPNRKGGFTDSFWEGGFFKEKNAGANTGNESRSTESSPESLLEANVLKEFGISKNELDSIRMPGENLSKDQLALFAKKIFKVENGMDIQQVKSAYRKLATTLHPDRSDATPTGNEKLRIATVLYGKFKGAFR